MHTKRVYFRSEVLIGMESFILTEGLRTAPCRQLQEHGKPACAARMAMTVAQSGAGLPTSWGARLDRSLLFLPHCPAYGGLALRPEVTAMFPRTSIRSQYDKS